MRDREAQTALVIGALENARTEWRRGNDLERMMADDATALVADLRSGEMTLAHCADDECSQGRHYTEHGGSVFGGREPDTSHEQVERRTYRLEVGPMLALLALVLALLLAIVMTEGGLREMVQPEPAAPAPAVQTA